MTTVYMFSPESGDLFTLDTVTVVTKTASNTLTKSSVMEGASIGDGFTKGNPQITFNGLCSYNKIARSVQSPTLQEQFIPDPTAFNLLLDEIIDSYQRFTLYGNDLIPDLTDVVIVDYTLTQSQFIDTIEVSLTVEQVFVSRRAIRSRITQPEQLNGSDLDVREKVDSGKGSKTQKAADEIGNTATLNIIRDVYDFQD